MARFPWRKRSHDTLTEKPASATPVAPFTKGQARHLTKTRKGFAIACSFLFFVSLVFLLLVQIGNTHNEHILTDWFMFKIDIADIEITSYDGGLFTNSLAQTVGLHDYYQVGLWGWCEGYDDGQGTTFCSTPVFGYWFNPVGIILSELFSGATITLPNEIYTYLNIIRVASHAMFGCFFAGTICAFICVFLTPLTLYSRLLTVIIGIFSVLSALVIIVGAIISTAMWHIFTNVINGQASTLGIKPIIGKEMEAFQWVAAACALIAGVFQLAMMCCCTSRRDVKHGKKNARKEIMKERYQAASHAGLANASSSEQMSGANP